MVPQHPIFIRIFICFISGFSCILNANSNVPDAGFTGEQKQTDEKLKLSYLCFRKDNLPTHIFNYFLQKENKTDNLLYVEDILNDLNGTLKYYLSFATNEQIWGVNDDQIVKSTIQLDPYFQKNSESFLREKTFFEINRRMAEARRLSEIDKIKNKSTDQTSEKSFLPTTETTMVANEGMAASPTTKESDATSLATYLLIIGAVFLVVTLLKKAFS
jgi:hypothetical protein